MLNPNMARCTGLTLKKQNLCNMHPKFTWNFKIWNSGFSMIAGHQVHLLCHHTFYWVPGHDTTPLVIISKAAIIKIQNVEFFSIENHANIYLLIGILSELFYLYHLPEILISLLVEFLTLVLG